MKMNLWTARRCVVSLACVLIWVFVMPTCIQGSQNCTSNRSTTLSIPAKTYPGFLRFPKTTQFGQLVNMTCGMNINAPADKILAFDFVFNIWTNDTCVPGEHLEIFDGSSASNTSIHKECKKASSFAGRRLTVYTSGPNGYIVLKTGFNYVNVVIYIYAVKPYVCPGVTSLTALSSTNQNITSPYKEYDLGYPPNTNCSWRIIAPPNHVILIQSNSQVNCDGNDQLSIYDSNIAVAARKLVSLCVSTSEPYKSFYSTGRDVYISFRSNVTFNAKVTTQRSFILYYQSYQPECRGGEMAIVNASSTNIGNITSPKSLKSSSYPPNSNCSWRITAPADHVVKIEVEAQVACDKDDHLKIYDSESYAEKDLLGRLCRSFKKEVFYSTGQDMYISFTSSVALHSSYWDRQFIIRYTAFKPGTSCSTSNTPEQNKNIIIRGTTTGTIQSPNFPNIFPNNLDCLWKFRAPPKYVVRLYFDTIDLKASSCPYASLQHLRVRDGYEDDSSILEFVNCYSFGHHVKPSFSSVSSGERLGVLFVSGSRQIKGYGFTANFTMQPIDYSGTCGEGHEGVIYLNGQASSIKSPGFTRYPRTKHPKNMKCVWNITVEQGYVIQVKVVDNELKLKCDSVEYARFIDGTALDNTTMFTLCNDNQPDTRYSTGNNMLIEFNTSSVEDRGFGFLVSYIAVRKATFPYSCSKNSAIYPSKTHFLLASFGYPSSYPNNAFCRWLYRVAFGKRARLIITKLELQNSTGCTADYVSVTGSDFYTSPNLGRFCGTPSTPINLTSSGNSIMVEFNSDWMGRYSGFEGILEAINDNSFGSCTVQGRDNIIPLNGSSGVFFSPRYPNSLPNSMSCIWQINTTKGSYVKIMFQDFNLHYQCRGSYLEIRDGPPQDPTSKVIARHCGRTQVPSLFSTGNYLWVHLNSTDQTFFERGFKATYSTVSALPLSISCRVSARQTIKASSGQIASYEYPLKYDNNVSCEWYITVDSSKRVKLTFDSFSLEDSSGCKGDHVAFYDGYYGDLLGKYCGGTKPDPVSSSGSTLYVKFATDGKGRYQGFKASFESILSVQTIIIIVSSSLLGFGLLCTLISWCIKAQCLGMCASGSQPPPADGTSVAGSNFQLTPMEK